MNRNMLWLVVFVLFLLEGTVLDLIIPEAWQTKVLLAPHLVLVMVLYIGLYLNPRWALIFGLIFGFLHDLTYYGPMLGMYAFSMAVSGYVAGLANRKIHLNLLFALSVIFLGSTVFELSNFGIYRVFKIMRIDLKWALTHQMLPSILVNLLFALIIYVPVRKWLESIELQSRSED